jgi:hypothetical protein
MLAHPDSPSSEGDASAVECNLQHASESKKTKSHSKGDVKDRAEKKKKRRHGDKDDGQSPYDLGDGEPKKKKKKKDEGRGAQAASQRLEDDGDSDIDANAQASTAALLNAIVAAVSSATLPGDPPVPHVYAPPPPHPQHLVPPPPFMPFPMPFSQFPPGMVAPDGSFPASVLNHMTFGTNDDVLRALHNMDMSKLAKGPVDPSIAANMSAFAPPTGAFAPPHPPPPPGNQLPVGSAAILNVPKSKATRHVAAPASSNSTAADRHSDLLATKWLSARKLAEMVETEGLVYKKGKFSATEERQVREAIESHKTVRPAPNSF